MSLARGAAPRMQNRVGWRSQTENTQVYAFSYAYDATGNRLAMRRESTAGTQLESAYYSYAADNSLTKRFVQPAGNSTYWYYDNNGNATVINDTVAGATYYAYGPHQLVTAIAPPAATQAPTYFYYDSRLNRYCQNLAGAITYFLWDSRNLLEERDSTGALNVRYTHGYTQIPGVGSVIEAQRTANGATYYQYLCMDHRGTVAAVTDISQNIQLAYTQDAFGRQLAGISGASPTTPNELIYQTNWRMTLIGGQYYWLSPSRIGDPSLGRFLGRDPLPTIIKVAGASVGNAFGIYGTTMFVRYILRGLEMDDALDSLNKYSYVDGNVIGFVDASGLVFAECVYDGLEKPDRTGRRKRKKPITLKIINRRCHWTCYCTCPFDKFTLTRGPFPTSGATLKQRSQYCNTFLTQDVENEARRRCGDREADPDKKDEPKEKPYEQPNYIPEVDGLEPTIGPIDLLAIGFVAAAAGIEAAADAGISEGSNVIRGMFGSAAANAAAENAAAAAIMINMNPQNPNAGEYQGQAMQMQQQLQGNPFGFPSR